MKMPPGSTPATSEPLEVCFVTCSGANGGIETCTRETAAYLADRGVPVTIIATVNDYYSAFIGSRDNLRVIHAMEGNDRPWSLRRLLAWAKLFRKLRASSVVLCHPSVFYFSNACFGAALAGVRNVVSIPYTANAFPRPREHRRYAGVIPGLGLWWHKLRTQIRCVLLASNSVLFATPEHAGKFHSSYELPPRNAWVVPHLGADVNVFRPCEASRSAVRRELGLDDHLCLIVYAARLYEHKGPDILIEALGRLPESVWRASRAVLLGEGPMAEQLRHRVGELGLDGHVRFIGYRPDLERYLAAGDIFVAPSRVECFGVSLVDAMACGCAAVATRVDGFETILRDPSVGVLVEPENPAAMSEAIMRLLDHPDLREEMGRRARAHIVSHYASDLVLEMLRELLVPKGCEPKLAQRVTHEMIARYRHEH